MAVFPVKNIAFPFLALAGIAVAGLAFSQLRALCLKQARRQRKRTMILDDVDTDRAENRISQLPDDVLCSIIQLLDIKDAVKTSILCRRWRNLYARVPHIRICCLELLGRTEFDNYHSTKDKNDIKYQCYLHKFVKAVDGLLRLSSGPKIQSFHLSCCFPTFCSNALEQWICSVGKLGVEYLSLSFLCYIRLMSNNVHKELFTFQCRVLSETPFIQKLHLQGCCLEPNFKSQCNSLKVLHLEYAFLETGILESILSSCLGLESLKLDACRLPSRLCIVRPGSLLKFLMIDGCKDLEEIEISTSNLQVFEYFGTRLVRFSLPCIPKLEKVCLYSRSPSAVSDILGEVSRSFPHVRSVVIQGFQHHKGQISIPEKLNTLSSIRHLTLSLDRRVKSNMIGIAAILDACRFLESFKFMSNGSMDQGQLVDWKARHDHTHLKEVEFWGFCCTENEIGLALYILRSAVALQQMSISRLVRVYWGDDKWSEQPVFLWKEETQKRISEGLQGRAVSESAKLVIRS